MNNNSGEKQILLKKVFVHNLKGVNLSLKPHQLIVFTGVSGCGKSSLAFDTIYVEGQRRYIESLPAMTRRYMEEMEKPNAESITGISPTVAIEQKTTGKNPRSTLGTMTGIYDYLRILYAKIGINRCPISHEVVVKQSLEQIKNSLKSIPLKTKMIILSPYAQGKKGEFKEDFNALLRKGYTRIRLDTNFVDISEDLEIDKKVAHDVDVVIDRIVMAEDHSRLLEALNQALEMGNGIAKIYFPDTEEEKLFSTHAYSPKSQQFYPPLEPMDFSFNHPKGMCEECQGLGIIQEFDLELIINPELSIAEDCCSIASSYQTVRYGNIYDNLAAQYKFSVKTPWKKLSETAQEIFLYGTKKKWTEMHFVHPTKRSSWTEYVHWRGVLSEAKERFNQAKSELYRSKMQELMKEEVCPGCKGAKIKPYPAMTTVGGKTIAEITSLPLDSALDFFERLSLSPQEELIAGEITKEITHRLLLLKDVGLHYLTLSRTAPTLSGGESQRAFLASQIGAGLVGATYILDEPSIGLHPRDNQKLLLTLKHLRDRGNTVIVVEHDEETILEADCIVDIGPLAGEKGGEIIQVGTQEELMNNPRSITGAYLAKRESISIPKKRRKKTAEALCIQKASHHNLKQVDVKIPLHLFVAITGVSGSGKSSLIIDTLYPALSNVLHKSKYSVGKHKAIIGAESISKVIGIDQSPIGKTPRSNPATYIKLFDLIRDLFSSLPQSQAKGLLPGQFSFNVKEGSCPHCLGMGMIKIDMDFMHDQWVMCTQCDGKRFDEETLQITYKGKTIADILEMRVSEAIEFFHAFPKIQQKLSLLSEIGLDYLKIGQPSPTLSGGEAQRIKLAKELSRRDHDKALYILDEPTTGLHFHDMKKLISVLHHLVEKGNSVVVIEHNMDLIKTADYIIDIGPEGGSFGGTVVGEGTPETIAKLDTPTGHALKHALENLKIIPKKHPVKPVFHDVISTVNAHQNNLKNINVQFPRGKISICTGPSGSGKTSFAFDTIYSEGQRRYIETLSPYARQFIKQMPKPKMDSIEGLPAAIAIEQKHHAGNPRSTVGTITECYDYLRILYAYLGTPYCPETGEKIETISQTFVVNELLKLPANTKIHVLSPLPLNKRETFDDVKTRLQKEGYLRIRLNGTYYELDEEIPFDKTRKNTLQVVIDRLINKEGVKSRLIEAISTANVLSKGEIIIDTGKEDLFFNLSFAVKKTGKSYPPLTPQSFSFNTGKGMCPNCEGLGSSFGAHFEQEEKVLKLSSLSLIEHLWKDELSDDGYELFISLLKNEKINPKTPLKKLTPEELKILFYGSERTLAFEKQKNQLRWIGINPAIAKIGKIATGDLKQSLLPFLKEFTCPACHGDRLNPLASHVRFLDLTIGEFCNQSIEKTESLLHSIALPVQDSFLEEALHQLQKRLTFLSSIGVGYLSLNRKAPTLSGGETQRIHLSKQLGSGLTGCLYVLDEPTIGLHPHNIASLNAALQHLVKLGNTLLCVEHDIETMKIADHILDFGPKAGDHGGQLMAEGTLDEIKNNPKSLTGLYLSGKKHLPIPSKRRTFKESILIENGAINNLKNITVSIPLNIFTCVTGVSGSGKSTLINDLLKPALETALQSRNPPKSISYQGAEISGYQKITKIIAIDQNPLGQTIRADISTYTEISVQLRSLFSTLPLAKAKGLQPRHFSHNHLKGMCTTCWGLGFRNINLQFLPPVQVTCESCHGYRLNPISLEVKYKDKHLGEILAMTIEEALPFLDAFPKMQKILSSLISVGLEYLTLNRPIPSLSGGEAQRTRLSREIARRTIGKTLYLFDEPTIGLHFEDIGKLLPIFHELVDKGHTVVIIEHNVDVLKNCDYIIDLGPLAGEHGGEIIATGTPEEIRRNPRSLTGRYLA